MGEREMKRKIQLKSIVKRAIEGYALSWSKAELLISFEDGTFIVIGAREKSWEDDSIITDIALNIYDFLEEDLIDSSIYSAKELTNAKEGIKNRNETLAEIAERALFERLKIKYEGLEEK
jgi:hypothetical protein